MNGLIEPAAPRLVKQATQPSNKDPSRQQPCHPGATAATAAESTSVSPRRRVSTLHVVNFVSSLQNVNITKPLTFFAAALSCQLRRLCTSDAGCRPYTFRTQCALFEHQRDCWCSPFWCLLSRTRTCEFNTMLCCIFFQRAAADTVDHQMSRYRRPSRASWPVSHVGDVAQYSHYCQQTDSCLNPQT